MGRRVKQGVKHVLMALVLSLFAGQAFAAVPIQAVTRPRPAPVDTSTSAEGAGRGETFSFGQVVDGVTGIFDGLWSSSSDAAKAALAENVPGETKTDKTKEAEAPRMIKAKRLDGDAPAKDGAGKSAAPAPTAPPPYKVYTAPMIMDEPSSTFDTRPRAYQAQPSRTFMPRSSESYAPPVRERSPIDTEQPPPLPEHVKRDLGMDEEVQPSSIAAALARIPAPDPETIAKAKDVPPLSAIPRQFFPILPFGAGANAPVQLLPVASSEPLEADHSNVSRVIVFVHDVSRNAAEGVATLMTLMGPERESTLILAPQFPLSVDVTRFAAHLPDQGRSVVRWPVETGWQSGADSVSAPGVRGISSFAAVDLLALLLTDQRRFPALRDVVFVGHGMGADFVHRYAALGKAPDLLAKDRLVLRFVAANPSSYLYFTNQRPSGSGSAFTLADAKTCPAVNLYPYGLSNMPPYARQTGVNAIRLRYPERQVIYLVGDRPLTDPSLDRSCGAMIQGQDRPTRARAYSRHVMQSFGDAAMGTQTFSIVRNAGYDPVSLFGSPCGIAALFGDGKCR